MVDQLFSAKKQPPSSPFSNGEFSNADTSTIEKQIDEMAWAGTRALPLQSLTPEEIALVEGENGNEGQHIQYYCDKGLVEAC